MTVHVLGVLGVGLVDPGAPVLHADDLGPDRGDGCFEGCHVRTDAGGHSSVDKLEAHLARMARSADALGLAFSADTWRDLVAAVLGAWTTPGETALKLVLTRGRDGVPTGYAVLRPIPPAYPAQRRDGLRVVTLGRGTASDAYADAPWLLGGVKTLSYAINMAAQREAVRRGADDAIFVSTDGYVLEAPNSTVVWAVGRTLRTTPVEGTGILGGTTQRLLFERAAAAGWRTEYRLGTVEDLHAADSVWLVGTVRGPVDIVELDGKTRSRDHAMDAEIRGLVGF